jgi:hypothetical protein
MGDAGVVRLSRSQASVDGLSFAAAEVARGYLERSAVTVTGTGMGTDTGTAAAYLVGALFALEHVARTVGVQRPAVPLDVLLDVLEPSR